MSDDLKKLTCFNNFGYIVLYELLSNNRIYGSSTIIFNVIVERIQQDNIILLEPVSDATPLISKLLMTNYISTMHEIGKNNYLTNLKKNKISEYANIITNFFKT